MLLLARRLALVALAVLAAGAFALGELARRLAARELVEARLSELLGQEFHLGGAEIRLAPDPRVRLRDVAVEPGAQVDELEVDLSDAALLQGRIEPDALSARGVRLTLVRRRDGTLGLGRGAPAGARPRLPALASLEVRDAQVTWIDDARPDLGALELAVSRFALDDLAPGRTARVAFAARVGPGGARGSLEVEAQAGPLGTELSPAGPGRLAVVARGLDAALAAAYLPPAWDLRLEGAGSIDAALRLRRDAAGALEGELDLALGGGALARDELRARAPIRLTGSLRRRDGALELRATRVEAAEVTLGALRAFQVAGTWAFAEGEIDGELRPAALSFAGVRLDSVSITGRLRPGASPEVRDGALGAERASLGRHAARDVTSRFALHAGTLAIEDLRFEAWGGRVSQRGRVELGTPPRIALDLEAEDLDVAALAGAETEGEPTLLSGRAQLSGPWTGEANWLAPLAGQGRVRFTGGALFGARTMRAITDALVAAVPGSGLVPDSRPRPRRTRLESAKASFVVRDGRLVSQDLDVVTGDYRARGVGSLGHDGSIELRAEVELSSRGVDQLASSLGSTRYLPRAFRSPAIPVVVTGSLAEPQMRADVAALPVATVRGLLGLPLRALDVVKGAGEAGTSAARGAAGTAASAARGVVGAGRRLLGLGDAGEPGEAPPEPAPPED